MTVWLIVTVSLDRKIRTPFELVFETESAAKLYIQTFGNPNWEAAPVILHTWKDVQEICNQ